jgi:hypothetical protein
MYNKHPSTPQPRSNDQVTRSEARAREKKKQFEAEKGEAKSSLGEKRKEREHKS